MTFGAQLKGASPKEKRPHVSAQMQSKITAMNKCPENLLLTNSNIKLIIRIPIYKSGMKSIRQIHRHISVLSLLSRIFERVVHERLCIFMDKYKIFYLKQFGFRSKPSPIHHLSDVRKMIRILLTPIFLVFCLV